jgi:predicted metal-dependent peptidase
MVTMTRGRDAHTWSKPHRRKLATPPHIYMPGRTGWKGPAIALEMDCSGSISDNQSRVFCGELAGILSDIEPSMVYVLMVDDSLLGEVLEIDDVNDVSRIKKAVMQGGGTDMGVVYQVIEERELPVELVVIMTDAYSPWPDEVHIPTVVCSTTDQKAPEHVGPTIRVRISE